MTAGQTSACLRRSRRVRQPWSMRLRQFGRIRCILACAVLRWGLGFPLPRVVMVHCAVAPKSYVHCMPAYPDKPRTTPPSVTTKAPKSDRASCTCLLPFAGHRARRTGVAADFMIWCPASDPATWILHRTFLYHIGPLRLLLLTG